MKMRRLVSELHEQQAESTRLDAEIAINLDALGFALPVDKNRDVRGNG